MEFKPGMKLRFVGEGDGPSYFQNEIYTVKSVEASSDMRTLMVVIPEASGVDRIFYSHMLIMHREFIPAEEPITTSHMPEWF